MLTKLKRRFLLGIVGATVTAVAPFVIASGMQPETSVVILYESEGETSINVKNTDANAALLYSTVENIPEDQESLVILTPPVIRVEPGDTQLIRFLRQDGEPSKTQRLKRAIFEGISQKINAEGRAVVGVNVRQNIPLIIHPKGLELNREPWKLLKWEIQNSKLAVVNESPYVVRMASEVVLNPSGKMYHLPRSYVLPGETLKLDLDLQASLSTGVTISPATVYGFVVDKYEAAISKSPNN